MSKEDQRPDGLPIDLGRALYMLTMNNNNS